MVERLATVQDVERSFGLPPRQQGTSQSAAEAREAGSPLSDHAFALSRSYEVMGVRFSTIALRPPRGHEFWEIGDIAEWHVLDGKQPVRIKNLANVRSYAERCASLPGESMITGAGIIEALDLRDTLAVRKAVVGFFTERGETGSA